MKTDTRFVLAVLLFFTGVSGCAVIFDYHTRGPRSQAWAAPPPPVCDEGSKIIVEVFGKDWKTVSKHLEPADRVKYLNAIERCAKE